MPYTNTENDAWNLLHNGSRVPVNDTGIDGAPAALSSLDPAWAQGSLNKAVYDTYILDNTFPEADLLDAEEGTIDLLRLRRYVNKDMLYGFAADARNRLIGDAMSFRGYPTPVINLETSVVSTAKSIYPQSLNSVVGTTVGRYIILKHSITLAWKVPYDIVYSITVTDGITPLYDLQLKVKAGNIRPTEWMDPSIVVVDPEEPQWNLLAESIYFSIDSSAMTGDKVFTINAHTILQAPYYGTVSSIDVTVLSADYAPIVNPISSPIGNGYYVQNLFNASCYVATCNEIPEYVLFQNNGGLSTPLYIPYNTPLQLGTIVYSNSALSVPATAGSYVFASSRYKLEVNGVLTYIYSVNQLIFVNSQGSIIGIYADIAECLGVSGCYPTLGCG